MNRALLASGATIGEMNCVRRHLSAIKGGRLAAACYPAHVLSLLISDVPGDRPIDIASGPTVPDPTSCADALSILRRYGIDMPSAVRELLESGRGESIKPGDPRLAHSEVRMVATPQMALEAAAQAARAAGVRALHLERCHRGGGTRCGEGTGRDRGANRRARPAPTAALRAAVGRRDDRDRARHRAEADAMRNFCSRSPLHCKAIRASMLWPATRMESTGKRRLPGRALGPTHSRVPGPAVCGPRTCSPITMPTASSLALGDAVVTGPTRTNVNDFRAILIEAR